MARAKSTTRKAPPPTLEEVMRTLEEEGSAQTRKTYARHGATEPMFGVSFAALKVLVKRIGVDHDLARGLWRTGNFDARNLALKVADPERTTPADLDRWAGECRARLCGGYAAMLAAETPLAFETANRWLAAGPGPLREAAWGLVAQMASRHPAVPDAWFRERLEEIERGIHGAPNEEREPMNGALIAIGGRSGEFRRAALAAAGRIGKVEVDHGDTSCKTPGAAAYIAKTWDHAKKKGFPSPAAQERERAAPRTRC